MKNRLIRSNISNIEEKSRRRSRVQARGFQEKSRGRDTFSARKPTLPACQNAISKRRDWSPPWTRIDFIFKDEENVKHMQKYTRYHTARTSLSYARLTTDYLFPLLPLLLYSTRLSIVCRDPIICNYCYGLWEINYSLFVTSSSSSLSRYLPFRRFQILLWFVTPLSMRHIRVRVMQAIIRRAVWAFTSERFPDSRE